ncbi:hypothetical protein RCL_jg29291.t1 [Rhizophagus clarus]|uniref:Uncharacterized protein n=1 Tax=Rhizophagus clarus TaxID=94130 RepID=A0A8H3L0Q1_9GLOM|nr:hypothetical protein RCL_jg29291.t1 [Rhizophagus clarus]
MSNMIRYLKFASSSVFRQCVRDENLELKNLTFRQIWSTIQEFRLHMRIWIFVEYYYFFLNKKNLEYIPFLDELELKHLGHVISRLNNSFGRQLYMLKNDSGSEELENVNINFDYKDDITVFNISNLSISL